MNLRRPPCDPSTQDFVWYYVDDLAEGHNPVAAHVVDYAQNESSPATWTVKVDRTRPRLEFTNDPWSTSPNWTGRSGNVDIAFRASDPEPEGTRVGVDRSGVRRVELLVDGNASPLRPGRTKVEQSTSCGTCPFEDKLEFDTADVTDGRHTVTVRVTDHAGNWRDYPRVIVVDNRTPTVQVLDRPATGQWVSSDATVKIAAEDYGVGIRKTGLRATGTEHGAQDSNCLGLISADGADDQRCPRQVTRTIQATDLPEGKNDLTAFADVPIGPQGTPLNPSSSDRGLQAVYYDNPDFTGAPLNRVDSRVNHNWGTDGPAPEIAPDDWSARWSGYVTPTTSDLYKFVTSADDGVRLWINDVLQIDKWVDRGETRDQTIDIPLTAGQRYKIRLDYYDRGVTAVAKLMWRRAGDPVDRIIPTDRLSQPDQGLLMEAFGAPNFGAGQNLDTVARVTRIAAVNENPGEGTLDRRLPVDNFSVRWTGTITPPNTGAWTFTTTTDDGVRLWIDGKQVIDDWTNHGATDRTATINLTGGKAYGIRVEYYEATGGAVASLRWTGPGIAPEIVPASRLRPATAPVDPRSIWVDRSGPTLQLEGTVYTRRDRTDDRRFMGLYERHAGLEITATDGATTSDGDRRSGVRKIEVSVDDITRGSVDQPCPSDSCTQTLRVSLDLDDMDAGARTYGDGVHRLAVKSWDMAGNLTERAWTVTVDRQGDVVTAQEHDGDPVSGGTLLSRESARAGTLDGRREVPGSLVTRSMVPCRDGEPGSGSCPELRHVTVDVDGDGERSYVSYRGATAADPRIDSAVALLETQDYGTESMTAVGPIEDAAAAWQALPPAHGSQFEKHVFVRAEDASTTSDGTSGETSAPATDERTYEVYIDGRTKLPIRWSERTASGELATGFWDYELERRSVSELPSAYFSADRPASPEQEQTVELRGAQSIGAQRDYNTDSDVQPYFVGNLLIIGTRVLCLADRHVVRHREPGRASDADATSDRDGGPDPMGDVLIIGAAYNAVPSEDACVPGTGSLDAPVLQVEVTARESPLAETWRRSYVGPATTISSTPTEEDYFRAGIQPILLEDNPTTAWVTTINETAVGALAETPAASILIRGEFTRNDLGTILAGLEAR